jgi:DNA-binding NarL/FixJ family response regulator
MDISMPRLNGLEATRRIRAEVPYVPIVILTAQDSDPALEAVKSGARGYLLKSIEPQALVGTLRGVVRGEACVSRAMAARLLEELARRGPVSAVVRRADLTLREREVLEQVAEGKTTDEVATALGIAETTVKNHSRGSSRSCTSRAGSGRAARPLLEESGGLHSEGVDVRMNSTVPWARFRP